jgi:pseudaminic acid synthase
MQEIILKNKILGENSPTYIIAEMSANHAGSIENAKKIIDLAKEVGADCIKVQTYTADTITINCQNEFFQIENGTWKGENLYNLYQQAFTPWEWQKELKDYAENIGLDFLSTPFDYTAVDFLESIGIAFYKIASFELIDIPLIEYIASKQKPIIMSLGMGTLGEIEEAVNAIRNQGNNQICLLKCSSAYPAIPRDMNLITIPHIASTFNAIVGLSDHTLGDTTAIMAVTLGAKVIEKHICINRAIKTPDSSFSMEPAEFKKMVDGIRIAEQALGDVKYSPSESEKTNVKFRKSIFVVEDIKAGELFTEKNIRVIRPGYGLKPKYYKELLGKTARKNLNKGTPLNWNFID